MLFNSIDFAIFLPIVFVLYWFAVKRSIQFQNILLLVASLVFYGWWDWKFLFLILFSIVIDYFVGNRIWQEADAVKRKRWLWVSLISNLGMLMFFKYFNFFIDNFIVAFSLFGVKPEYKTLQIILPVGISFYTFQTLSYTIDIYKRKLEPASNFISFAAFVSFFPQLVAGPIERASNLLPQFSKERIFNIPEMEDGLRQILWGLFKKIAIADSCAKLANITFQHTDSYSGLILFAGAVFFALQIYGDFSGYSDIAIGTARLFGFRLMQNFSFPYFSRDIAEFWRRWHISLSTWFRDYVYIPLGGSRGTKLLVLRNTLVIFLVSGFWHGANWTFIAWGALHALYFIPLIFLGRNKRFVEFRKQYTLSSAILDAARMSVTFFLVTVAWVFFRAQNIDHAVIYLENMFGGIFATNSYAEFIAFYHKEIGLGLALLVFVFLCAEWLGRHSNYAMENWHSILPIPLRWFFYVALFFVVVFMQSAEQQFIYFQF